MSEKPVGVVGLGYIGLALTTRLIQAGHEVVGYRRGDPTTFLSRGGVAARSIPELAQICDVIFLALPNGRVSGEVITSITASGAQATILDVTTQPPAFAVENATRAAAGAHIYIEAPIGGAPAVVEAGDGQFLIGASIENFSTVEPLLRPIAKTVLRVGELGSASALKSAALLIMTVNIVAAAEGLAFATSYGVDPAVAVEAFLNGPAGSTALRHRGPLMASGDFKAKLGGLADFQALLKGIANSASTSTKMFDCAIDYVADGIAAGIGDEDIAGLYGLIARSRTEKA